jgi:hypothetical protein
MAEAEHRARLGDRGKWASHSTLEPDGVSAGPDQVESRAKTLRANRTAPLLPPPDWHSDPHYDAPDNQYVQRYWDGALWTPRTRAIPPRVRPRMRASKTRQRAHAGLSGGFAPLFRGSRPWPGFTPTANPLSRDTCRS